MQGAEYQPEKCWKNCGNGKEKQNLPNENSGCSGHCFAFPSSGHSKEQPGCLQQECTACVVFMHTPSVLEVNALTGWSWRKEKKKEKKRKRRMNKR